MISSRPLSRISPLCLVPVSRRLSLSTYPPPSLCGRCSCGKVGYIASGPSYVNFYSHSTPHREASGCDYIEVSGFSRSNVRWTGEHVEYRPCSSSDPLFLCPCDNKEFIGVDATRLLGMVACNLRLAEGYSDNKLPDMYRPNHHLFYADRVVDVEDGLPKWATVLHSDILPERNTKNKVSSIPSGICDGKDNRPLQWIGPDLVQSTVRSGSVRKDVLPLSPVRPPEPTLYHFPDADYPVNNTTVIPEEAIVRRVARKYHPSPGVYVAPSKTKRESIVIGGGHNGLIAAAYLAKKGVDVCVLERRHLVGGCAVTEEIIPGFKFSRASYLAGLLRPQIIEDLELHRYGFKYLPRNPSSFTPTLPSSPYAGKYLILGDNAQANYESIAQFSKQDAEAYPLYEEFLGQARDILQPLLDNPLPCNPLDTVPFREKVESMKVLSQLIKVGYKHKEVLVPFYELFTGPAQHILDRWFESEILKTTLATDAVVGALVSLKQNGSAYVLLHHVMGEAGGKTGVWSYVEGGMGSISNAIAASAQSHGADIVTNATVRRILYDSHGKVTGVEMADGSQLHAEFVLSGCTPFHTFMELLPGLSATSGYSEAISSPIPKDFTQHIRFSDYSCGAFKINCAVTALPNFTCYPSPADGSPGPMHQGTVHFECLTEEIEHAFREASMGMPATRPVIEMTIPSAVDSTLAPPGHHVVQLFVQFAPYDVDPKIGSWADPVFKESFADRVCGIIDEFCPGFSASIIGRDVLSPLDLERVFGLQRGQICHGSLSLHQLGYARPMAGYSDHRTPLKGLYMCSAGTHPGGGVMGAPGKNCAQIVLRDMGK
mmetsp:Transcript_4881/g.7431  ORF Transcript_4881/g.7431 Transcript_4881/m.7431 type:complete len:828 (+) Transcript_4881:54-2537(+)